VPRLIERIDKYYLPTFLSMAEKVEELTRTAIAEEVNMTTIDKLMSGSIDMHIHFVPDSLVERRQNAFQLAQSAREAGIAGIVLKSREYMTVPIALLVNELVPDISVFGSLTLDNPVGGLNPAAVLVAARMGAKVVWMPTVTAANSKAKYERMIGKRLEGPEQSILDQEGSLLPQVREIIQIVKEYDIVLGSGHLAPREIFTLVEETKAAGFSKMVITHPLQDVNNELSLSADDIGQLAQSGCFIEHCFWACMPSGLRQDPKTIVESVKATGVDHCIMTTDLGQWYNPTAPEGMRAFIATMLQNGLDEDEIEVMVKRNPSKLLGL
jgi:hypothetical protein